MASYERYKEYASLTAAELAAVNNIFPEGQLVVEADTGKMKVGDGTTAYNSLPYGPTTLSSLTLPNGTANGVLYLNASKVVTSGSALTFDGTNFGTTGAALIGNQAGTGTSGSLRFITAGGVNYVQSGQNTTTASAAPLAFTDMNGSGEWMRLNSTGLGIGTNNPGERFVVANSSGSVAAQILASATGTSNLYFADGTTGADSYTGFIQYNHSTNAMSFGTNGGTTRAIISADGNLGLGVTPSAWGSGRRSLSVSGSSANYFMGANANATVFGTNFFYDDAIGDNKYVATGTASMLLQSGGAFQWFTAASGNAGDPISFTQAMTLNASGNLLVGTTVDSGYRLALHYSSGPYVTDFYNTNTSTNQYNVSLWRQAASGSAIGYVGSGGSAVGNAAFANNFVVGTQTSSALVFNTADTERARIPAAGGMVIGTAALATTATDGFLYVPTCAGTPTGTPTTQTGTAPIVVDTTNNKLYFYSGGQWRDAGP